MEFENFSKRSEKPTDWFDEWTIQTGEKEAKPRSRTSKTGFIYKMNFQVTLFANLKIETYHESKISKAQVFFAFTCPGYEGNRQSPI